MKLYKYCGEDNGIAYIYFFGPVAEYLVNNWVPEWIAPNLITFMGFVCNIIPFTILYTCIGAALIGDVPGWFVALQGIFYFVYRMFDEMDGKQARKTKNGTPFGMIFDHGIDCFAAGIQPMIFARIIQIGDNFIAKIFFFSVFQAFHFVTLEHYYFGKLVMPFINGVSDGCIIVSFLSVYTVIVGPNHWATPVCDGRWL